MIENTDRQSKDYGDIKDKFRPGHADYTYMEKYGVRDYRGGGRQSARETAARVAAGAIAGHIARSHHSWRAGANGSACNQSGQWDWDVVEENPFWCLTNRPPPTGRLS